MATPTPSTTGDADDATLAPPSAPPASRLIDVGDRVIYSPNQERGIAVVTELSMVDDTARIMFFGVGGIDNAPVSDLQLAPPPTPTSPMMDLIVPPNSKEPEKMPVDELMEALYAIGDRPELREVLTNAKAWRVNRKFEDESYNHRHLAGLLRYCRDKLMLGFGIEITPSVITIAEVERVALADDSVVAEALHAAGVDLGRYELITDDDGSIAFVSFLTVACSRSRLGMVKKAISWGAYCEDSVIASAYTLPKNAENSSEMLALLVDECGLDVNFDIKMSDNEDIKRFFEGAGFIPLLNRAVLTKEIELAKVLLDRGAIVDYVKGWVYIGSDLDYSPLKTAVLMCCAPSIQSNERQGYLEVIDLLLRRGASMRMKETADHVTASNINNILMLPVMGETYGDCCMSLAVLAKLLHVGKPDTSVVEEALQFHNNLCNPISARILSDYLLGKPVCCDVCEKLTSANGSKLMLCPCRTIAYCSRECQLKGWKEHKLVCGDKLGADGKTEALVKKREHRKKKGGGK
jgi:hypothetical protein